MKSAAFEADEQRIFPHKFSRLYGRERYRHHGFKGGRGATKSHTVAQFLALEASETEKLIVCGRQFQNSIADSSKALLEDKIKALGLQHEFRTTNTSIVARSTKSEFIFIGLDRNPDSARSLEGADICWVEEAQSIKAASLDTLVPTVRKPGSYFIWTWNPMDPSDPVDDMLCGPAPAPRSYVEHLTYLDNPWFKLTELPAEMRAMRLRDPQKYKHVWLGEYRKLSDAQIFKNWRVGRVQVPEGIMPRFGLDFGFGSDPLAGVKLYAWRKPDGGMLIFVAAETGGLGVPTERIPASLDKLTESRRFPVICDSARPDTVHYLQTNGFPLARGAIKGPNSLEDGISWLQSAEIVIDPDCKNVAYEAKHYTYETDRRTGEPLPVPKDANNHWWDAIRYAVEDVRLSTGVKVTRHSLGRRR